MRRKRIGVFGGSFDPPHLGHLILAEEALHQMHLDQLLWVLTPQPPHKIEVEITSLPIRQAMLKLATAENPRFELSRLEIDRPGPHYTLDTLRLLKEQQPDTDLILLLGGDSLHDLPDWHDPAGVIAICKQLGIMRRPGDQVDLTSLESILPGISRKIAFIDAPLLEIASRDIRQRIKNREPFRYYLPASVYAFILDKELYR